MDEYIIRDRKKKNYSRSSISKYKKKDLISYFKKVLEENDIYKILYVTTEMVASCYFDELYGIFFIFMSEYIHILNPVLPKFILVRYKRYKYYESLLKENKKNILNLRNISILRTDISEIVSFLHKSPKKHIRYYIPYSYDHNKLIYDSISDVFTEQSMPDIEILKEVLNNRDNKEIIQALKELHFYIDLAIYNKYKYIGHEKESKDRTFYWLGRILESGCQYTNIVGYPFNINLYHQDMAGKGSSNYIYVIWNMLLVASKYNKVLFEQISALYEIYCLKMTKVRENKETYHILHTFLYFYERVMWDNPIGMPQSPDIIAFFKNIQHALNNNKRREDYIQITDVKKKKKKKKEIPIPKMKDPLDGIKLHRSEKKTEEEDTKEMPDYFKIIPYISYYDSHIVNTVKKNKSFPKITDFEIKEISIMGKKKSKKDFYII